MRFSRNIGISGLALVILSLGAARTAATSYKADPNHSGIAFTIEHEQNKIFGIFPGLSGTIELSDDGGSLDLSVKAAAVNTGVAKRDEHLKGPDFFAVAQFPTIHFKSTKVVKTADGFDVTGELTLHGVTKEISLPLKVTEEAKGMQPNTTVRGIEGKFSIKRSDFGMKTYLPAVGDDVELMVSISAQKQ